MDGGLEIYVQNVYDTLTDAYLKERFRESIHIIKF